MAVSGFSLQGGGTGSSSFLQPSSSNNKKLQAPSSSVQLLQPTVSGISLQGGTGNGAALNQSGTGKAPVKVSRTAAVSPDTGVAIADPAAKAAAAKAAADAAQAGSLRGEVTNLVNSIKNLLNQRYGQLDAAATEQVGKLDDRFQNESTDLTTQVEGQNQQAGAAGAAGGVYDSSYRGNNQDTITHAGEAQIRDLGNELQDNKAAVGNYVQKEKAGLDSQKGGYDATVAHLAEETDPGRLTDLRNQIDAKLREVQAGSQDNATQKDSITALNTIAPTNARAQQLQTTLAKIIGGSSPTPQKSAIGAALIKASGVSDSEAQRLQEAFQSDLSATDKQQVQQ